MITAMPSGSSMHRQRAGVIVINWGLAYIFALFAVAHLRLFLQQPRLSLVLIVAVESLLVVFLLIRRDADYTWHSWRTWLPTLGGTFFPLLLRPIDAVADIPVGQALQITGAILQIAALLSLNRSMGLLPANRGLQSNGMYRLVRHPLYLAYTIALVGYLISNWSAYNAVVILVGTCFQIVRIRNEERLLRSYPEFSTFVARTRWRMIPYVW